MLTVKLYQSTELTDSVDLYLGDGLEMSSHFVLILGEK